ncbi:MAG TPA: hypothetical protein DGH68_04015 [Bacteroidetes bacterium]|jgi:hypothetical protein|nr:hypothetical protein [Bacteroidota bacterium]
MSLTIEQVKQLIGDLVISQADQRILVEGLRKEIAAKDVVIAHLRGLTKQTQTQEKEKGEQNGE